MNEKRNDQSHIINDPIHGVMVFTVVEKAWIKEIINHELFQRLRHIKQLGCTDLIFPGAVHTRFNHSIGACYLAKKVCDQLLIQGNDKKIAMIAALLHDIGHGPFSHTFERIYAEKNAIKHDEHWVKCFLNKLSEDCDVLKDIKVDVEAAISHSSENYQPNSNYFSITSDIVSSQMDVDRLDYLMRDSHFCGVSYGQIDINWLLGCLTQVDLTPPRLGITRKGIGALEHFIMARRLMTRNIYYHGKKNAAEYYLTEFLKTLKPFCQVINSVDKNVLEKNNLVIFLNKIDKLIHDGNEKVPSIHQFVKDAFPCYAKLVDYDIWYIIRQIADNSGDHDCIQLAKRLHQRSLPSAYPIEPSSFEKAKMIIEEVKSKRKIRHWQIHVEQLNFTSYQTDTSPIFLSDHGFITDIRRESTIFDYLSDIDELSHWLYIDREILANDYVQELLNLLNEKHCLHYSATSKTLKSK